MDHFQSAQSIHIYLSHATEVETDLLIQETLRLKKRVLVPVLSSTSDTLHFSELPNFDPAGLEVGPFGIRQPRLRYQKIRPASSIDLWILPGVGFDLQGNRLGYGLGYFDRALQEIELPAIGLAFDLQVVDYLPLETTDRPVSQIVTETRTLLL